MHWFGRLIRAFAMFGLAPSLLAEVGVTIWPGQTVNLTSQFGLRPPEKAALGNGKGLTARIKGHLDIRLAVTAESESNSLFLVTPSDLEPGEHTIELRNAIDTTPITVRLAVEPLPRFAAGPRPPVVLVNGYDPLPTCKPATSTRETFGQLEDLLVSDGLPRGNVILFDNCAYAPNKPIEDIAQALGQFISSLRYTDEQPVLEVDIVAHSMGGLITRSYLSGKRAGRIFAPPKETRVRKIVSFRQGCTS